MNLTTSLLNLMGVMVVLLSVLGTDRIEASETKIVQINREFSIELNENPSTGYKWEINFDKEFLRLQKRDYRSGDPTEPPRPGAGGKAIFFLVPLRTGETQLTFTEKRPWEKDPVKIVTIPVRIVDQAR
ncbi:MAG: protease inhibitor I42 family protein [Pseudomonadota bacterium]